MMRNTDIKIILSSIVFIALVTGYILTTSDRLEAHYMEHVVCWSLDYLLVTVRSIGHGLTVLSYTILPGFLIFLLLNLDLRLSRRQKAIVALFAAFILCCGIGHLFEIIENYETRWFGLNSYYISAWWSVVVGLVSIATAIVFGTEIIRLVRNYKKIEPADIETHLSTIISNLTKHDKQIKAYRRVTASFEDPDLSTISIKDLQTYVGQGKQALSPGVVVDVYINKDGILEIYCEMEEGVALPIHLHPDYNEWFYLLTGELIELVTGTVYPPGPPFVFMKYVPHHLKALKPSTMRILCKDVVL